MEEGLRGVKVCGDSKAAATVMRERRGDGDEGAATGQRQLQRGRGQWGWRGGKSDEAAMMAMEGGLRGIKAARRRVVRQGSGVKSEEEVARWQGKGRG